LNLYSSGPQGRNRAEFGSKSDLSVIQRCYDLIVWFIPRLERLPRGYRFTLGDRIQNSLYGLLERLIAPSTGTPLLITGRRAGERIRRLQARLR